MYTRPAYHVVAPRHWLNDPNGLIQWRGRYHLFYQYDPNPAGERKSWGHAVSDDLLRWRHLPVALEPGSGPDQDGCWSGCTVVHDGTPTILYTGVRNGVQLPCLATAVELDELSVWRKYERNPIIPEPPPGLELAGFRDHTVWLEDGEYRQLIGSGIRGVGGCVFLYRSPDLVAWGPPSIFLTASETAAARDTEMWECPDFFPLGDRHVLVTSAYGGDGMRRTLCFAGSYTDGRFAVEREQVLDWGGHYYAPQSFTDRRGRRIMFGWLPDPRGIEVRRASGWSGALAFPRVVRLDEDGLVRNDPVPELLGLRDRSRSVSGRALPARALDAGLHEGTALEIEIEFGEIEAGAVTLALRALGGGDPEETSVVLDGRCRVARLERRQKDRTVQACGGPARLEPGARLRVFLDGPVVEAFIDGGAPLAGFHGIWSQTERVAVSVSATDGVANIRRLDIWHLTQP